MGDMTPPVTGRCYCGKTSFSSSKPPQVVVYCHCSDCKRLTGAPVAAFAAFADGDVTFSPDEGRQVSIIEGCTRSFCTSCGSNLTGRYEYLPGQIYIAVGLIDQADDFPPSVHAHYSGKYKWLHLEDDLPKSDGSSRKRLNSAGS